MVCSKLYGIHNLYVLILYTCLLLLNFKGLKEIKFTWMYTDYIDGTHM